MKLLLDTNVVLDVLLAREPFAEDSARIMAAVEQGRIEGYLCATTLTTLHYLVARHLGQDKALRSLADLLKIFRVAPVNGAVLSQALKKPGRDYEDAVLVESARLAGLEGIITRNQADFRKAKLPIYTPKDALKILQE